MLEVQILKFKILKFKFNFPIRNISPQNHEVHSLIYWDQII